MLLTGRFDFRKTLMGKIVLRVEEDRLAPWPFSLSGRLHRRWRDARFMDLVRPEIRGLINLRDYALDHPRGNYAAPDLSQSRRALDRLPDQKAPPAPRGERQEPARLHGTLL